MSASRQGTATHVEQRDSAQAGRRAVARGRLAGGRLDQRVREAEEAEGEQPGGDGCSPRPPGREAAGDDQDLADEERRGRQAGERAERDPEHRAERGLRAADAARRVAGRARFVAEQRRRRVEAERLRERVPDDVDRDAGERERRAEADAERDHAHVLEARVGEQPLPGQRLPEERHGDGEREQAEADQDGAGGRRSDHRASAWLERQATSSTAGSSAAESSAETGAGASEWASGSQLCTGAQPIFAASPASSSR